MFSLIHSGPVAEKADEELFFIGKAVEEQKSPKPRKRKWKPLRSEANLQPDTTVQPFPGRKRKKAVLKRSRLKAGQGSQEEQSGIKQASTLDSSDEEFDDNTPYAVLVRQQQDRIAAVAKRNKPKTQLAARDLWADEGRVNSTYLAARIHYEYFACYVASETADIPDEHYLRVTRKMPIKVGIGSCMLSNRFFSSI